MPQDPRDGPEVDASGAPVLLARLQGSIYERSELSAAVVALFAVLFLVRGLHEGRHGYVAAGFGALFVARALALGRRLTAAHIGGSASLVVVADLADGIGHAAIAWLSIVAAGVIVGLPRRSPAPGTADDRRHVWALVDSTPDDTLAPFTLRTDKSYAFSPDRAAAVAYRVRFGTAVASGDPVGASGSRDAALDAFLTAADASGWRAAALGVSDRSLAAWRTRGMSAVPIGRDVVLDVATFSMDGRAFRNLRQAVQRSRNAGVTTEVIAERDLSDAQRGELEQVLTATGKGQQPRGFAMILDHVLDGTHPGMLIAIARDRDGRAIAFHRYASAAGGRELSLDVPWRAPGAPNGVEERLIADVLGWARERGVARVSLTFAAFPELFAASERSLLQQAAYRTVRQLDRFIRLESLHRFVRKFHAFGGRRYVVLRRTQVLWVALAALALEFGKPRRMSGRGSR